MGGVDRSEHRVDGDGARRTPHREFRLGAVATGGVGGVAGGGLMTETLVSSISVTATARVAGAKAMAEGPKRAVAATGAARTR